MTAVYPFLFERRGGAIHDIDELSSGEKEILYGYLRIRSSAPKDSIILLDEPELHLNPRLIRGLPEFYRKHLGETLQNQLWLVTHSDSLIREAIGKPGFNVFHMLPCGAETEGQSQLKPLASSTDIDPVLADLVGDLAAYRPGGKGVIFEGGGDSDFDKTIANNLFSEELRGINLISGSNKAKVSALHEVLSRAHRNGDLPTKFFSIVDSDSDQLPADNDGVTAFQWDVYHVENYLLEPRFVANTVNSFALNIKMSDDQALQKLSEAARLIVPKIVIHQLKAYVNTKLVSTIDLNFDPKSVDVSAAVKASLDRSFTRMSNAFNDSLTENSIRDREIELKKEIEASFGNGSWRSRIPGRDILRKFVQTEKIPTNYEAFRNQIVSRMSAEGYKPAGMKLIIDRIRND